MKKQLSIVLSLLMIVIVVHPFFAMHFCGPVLSEVVIMNDTGMNSCCEESGNHSHSAALEAKDCCHTHVVSLDTDEYQSVTTPSIPVPADCVLLALFTSLVEQPVFKQISAYTAPPGVVMADDVSLPFICIYRI